MNQRVDFEQASQYTDNEIDLIQLVATLWAGKWIVIAFTILFAVGGVAFALMKPDIYQASVLVAPANDEGGVKGLSGQLGGLASLAGINLGGGGSNQTVIAKEVLQSRAFLTDFIRRHQLAVPLKAVNGWSKKNQQWKFDREVYNPKTGQWLADNKGVSFEPTDWDLVKAFKERHLNVSESKNTGMLTVRIKSFSPVAARDWASFLIADLNEYMRLGDVAEAEARVAYLEKKLSDTNITGVQQVFYKLIENEIRTVMLANARQEYVFKTIDPAVVPQEKSEPKRGLIVVLAILLGGMLGIFVVLLRLFFNCQNKPAVGDSMGSKKTSI